MPRGRLNLFDAEQPGQETPLSETLSLCHSKVLSAVTVAALVGSDW